MSCPLVKLNDGTSIPSIGLGTFNVEPNMMKDVIIKAVKNGYRHIDCAMVYGNEARIGEALKEIIPQICTREELFITTKIWCTDYDPDDVELSLKISLKKLGLDYVNLYLFHWPMKIKLKNKRDPNDIDHWLQNLEFDEKTDPFGVFENIDYSTEWFFPTWTALEECVRKGLTRSVGVCNLSIARLDSLLKFCKIKPTIHQIELHPGLVQQGILDYCLSHDIQVEAYCPLACPPSPDTGNSFHYYRTEEFNILKEDKIVKLSEKYQKTPGQIILRWAVQRHTIPIPKSSNEKRMAENLAIFDFSIDEEDMKIISSLDRNYRLVSAGPFLKDRLDLKELWG